MGLGVFTQWLRASSAEELASQVRDLELHCGALDSYPWLSIDFNRPHANDPKRIRNAFRSAGVGITAVGGYGSMVHRDPENRKAIHRWITG